MLGYHQSHTRVGTRVGVYSGRHSGTLNPYSVRHAGTTKVILGQVLGYHQSHTRVGTRVGTHSGRYSGTRNSYPGIYFRRYSGRVPTTTRRVLPIPTEAHILENIYTFFAAPLVRIYVSVRNFLSLFFCILVLLLLSAVRGVLSVQYPRWLMFTHRYHGEQTRSRAAVTVPLRRG